MSWAAPAVCPNQAQVLERIEAARGGPLPHDGAIAFVATVTEKPNAGLTLTVHTPSSEGGSPQARVLEATECEELVAAFVQIVSLALGPATAPPSSEAEGPTRPEATTAAALPSSSGAEHTARANEIAPKHGDSTDSEREDNGHIALFAVLDTGALGEASLGAELTVSASLGSVFELRGVLGYVPPQTVTGVSGDEDAGGRFGLAFMAALGCASVSKAKIRVPLCAGVEAGRLNASGAGVSDPESSAVTWVALRADVMAGFELTGALRVTLLAGLVAPLNRHEFSVAGTELFRIPALSARAGLGLEYAF